MDSHKSYILFFKISFQKEKDTLLPIVTEFYNKRDSIVLRIADCIQTAAAKMIIGKEAIDCSYVLPFLFINNTDEPNDIDWRKYGYVLSIAANKPIVQGKFLFMNPVFMTYMQGVKR